MIKIIHVILVVFSSLALFVLTGCSSSNNEYCESLQMEIKEDLIALNNLPSEFDKEFWEDDDKAAQVIGIKKHLEKLQAEAGSISCNG